MWDWVGCSLSNRTTVFIILPKLQCYKIGSPIQIRGKTWKSLFISRLHPVRQNLSNFAKRNEFWCAKLTEVYLSRCNYSQWWIYCTKYLGQISGLFVKLTVIQWLGSGFNPQVDQRPFSMEFACSPHADMDFLQVIRFLLTTVCLQLATVL